MKNNVENKIQVNFKNKDRSNKDKNIDARGNIIIAAFIYIVIVLSLLSLFDIDGVNYLPILLGLIVILGFGYYFEYNKRLSPVLLLPLFLLLVFIFIQSKYIQNGIFLTINQIAKVIGSHTGYLIKQYDVNIGEKLFARSITNFWILISTIIGYISIVSVRNNSSLILWILIVPIYILEALTGIMPGFIYNVLLFLIAMIIASNSFVKTSKEGLNSNRGNMILHSSIFFILFFIISALIIAFILPVDNYSKNSIAVGLKNNINNKIEDYRYEKIRTNSFTNGDFRGLGELELSKTKALEVKMDEPTSLYLKGYIGSKYTSQRWTDLDNNIYYDSHPLFYWLNESNFNGLGQLSTVNELVMGSSEDKDKININIKNVNGNSKYVYIPYELDFNANINDLDDARNLSDEKLISKNFKGSREYSYVSNRNLVTRYPELVGKIYKMKDKEELKEYIEDESHYNEFVYKNYTHIPKNIEELIKNQFGELINEGDSHIPYEMAIGEVKDYLRENIEYTEDPSVLPKGRDFLSFLLEDSREGFSTHYATAATAIFRYLDIPSRYVEGYLITPEDVDGVSAGKEIPISGENAHAWTEIYLDQLGWIPIEVTPLYEDVMDPIDLSKYPGGGDIDQDMYDESQRDYEEGVQEIIDDEEIQSSRPKEKAKKRLTALEIFLIILALSLLILISIYVIYLIKNRKRLKKLEASFMDSNHKLAIPRIFSYSMHLMHYNGMPERGGSIYSYTEDIKNNYSEKYVDVFKKAIAINQEALYSNKAISEEQYDYIMRFKNQVLHDLLESKSIFQRIKMKLWDFVY